MNQRLQLIRHRGDPIQAGMEQGRCFKPADRLLALEATIGVTANAAVLLHQVGQRLVSPIRRQNICELNSRTLNSRWLNSG